MCYFKGEDSKKVYKNSIIRGEVMENNKDIKEKSNRMKVVIFTIIAIIIIILLCIKCGCEKKPDDLKGNILEGSNITLEYQESYEDKIKIYFNGIDVTGKVQVDYS